jgi:hypothetical protein
METQRINTLCVRSVFSVASLESYLYTAQQHPALAGQTQASFLAQNAGLKIKQVSRVDDRLGTHGQAEGGQTLRNHNAEARIVDSQLPFERIYRKNRRLRRKAKDRSHARARFKIGYQLAKKGLEESAFENMCRIGDSR